MIKKKKHILIYFLLSSLIFTSCNNTNEYADNINVNDKDLKIEGINILNKNELKRIYDNSKTYEIKAEIKTNKGNSKNLIKFIDANLVNVYTTNGEVANINQNKIIFFMKAILN